MKLVISTVVAVLVGAAMMYCGVFVFSLETGQPLIILTIALYAAAGALASRCTLGLLNMLEWK